MIQFLYITMPAFQFQFLRVLYVVLMQVKYFDFGVCLQVSLSAFAFLFSEIVQYNQTQVDNIAELERRW